MMIKVYTLTHPGLYEKMRRWLGEKDIRSTRYPFIINFDEEQYPLGFVPTGDEWEFYNETDATVFAIQFSEYLVKKIK